MRIPFRLLFWGLVLVVCNTHLNGQVNYEALVKQLEASAKAGQKRALRDLGSLLDKTEVSEKIKSILLNQLILTETELKEVNGFNKKDFLRFYYDHEHSFTFSELAEAYFITPLNEHDVEYETRTFEWDDLIEDGIAYRLTVDSLNEILSNSPQKSEKGLAILRRLCEYKTEPSYHYLLTLIQDELFKSWKAEHRTAAYSMIANYLTNYQELESFNAILHLISNNELSPDLAQPLLTSISNIKLAPIDNPQQLVDKYSFYLDSLGSLQAMRRFGYEQVFQFRMNFFESPVDYYGKILNSSDEYPWIEFNAFQDLVNSAHPRSLFYLAAHLYKNRDIRPLTASLKNYTDALLKYTQLELAVKNSMDEFVYKPFIEGDSKARKNFLIYWSKHYNDYEWDENHSCFTNKEKAQEITQNYERLFRRLNSKNDSVAVKSFIQLTEGDPTQVIELATKYRQLLRTYNSTLPSLNHKYLEQMVLLTQYAKSHQFTYKASASITQILDQLLQTLKPSRRYQLENELLQQMTLEDLTPLEYHACLYEKNKNFSFSMGRVLDYFYSKHWDDIIQNDNQLLLYLKKSYLFAGIGVFGSSNYYLSKFDMHDQSLQARLNKLYRLESDSDIINQISQLIIQPEAEYHSITLAEFLEEPALFSKRDIKTLSAPSEGEYEKIIRQIKTDDDIANIKQLFYYLRLHPNQKMVPFLFELIDDERIIGRHEGQNILVADNIIPSLEDIFNYSFEKTDTTILFTTAEWAALWKNDGANYKQWMQNFFEEKFKAISDQETLTIDEINKITDSRHFNEDYKKRCLQYLKKVRPIKDIIRLHLEQLLAVESDLPFFEDFYFGYKELDDLPKLFDITLGNAGTMLTYLQNKSAKFSISERGLFYNSLFKYPWFVNFVSNQQASSPKIQEITSVLMQYLDESDYLSEYEEQITNLHLAQLENLGKPVEVQLAATIIMNTDEASRFKIQQTILAGISYSQLDTVAQFFKEHPDQISWQTFNFLSRDFGLPVYDIKDAEALDSFLILHRQLSEYDFYRHYLDAFGVEYMCVKNKLDFQKIYDILEFDIVTPFVSQSGGRRDYYIYGIIKILELHFNTRLDFHEKLNENQTFYTFTSTKRAVAWMEYLKEKQLVKFRSPQISSFSPSRKDF